MTQSSLQTQCPQCETRFRVTDEQLNIAGGKVRCGNCMHVFNAIDHQVLPERPQPQPEPSPAPSDDTPPGQAEDDEDLVFEDNPEEDATESRYTGSALTFSDDELSDSFRNFDQDDDSSHPEHDLEPGSKDQDESWAEAILEEDDEPEYAPDQPPVPEYRPEPAREPKIESEPEPERQKEPGPATEPEQPPSPPEELHLTAGDDDRVTEPELRASKPSPEPDNLYQGLRHEPVSVRRSGGGLRKAFWTLVVLALIGGLAAQVAWFQFDRLAAIPQLRPFYEQACQWAGCTLKPLINVEAVESRKLVVRTNPDNRNQLIVDAVIVNTAGFEQPFPAIALTFSNLNGDVVAQSTFTPNEYLAESEGDKQIMPRKTPVRISIDIRDPGRDAVNYNLSFVPWEG